MAPTYGGQPTTVVAANPGTQVLPAAAARPPVATPPPPTYEEPRRTGWLWAGIVLALLVLGVGGFLLFQALNEDEPDAPTTITMPDLVNVPLDEATKELADLGFTGTITQTPETNDAVAENIVFRQDPAAEATVPIDGQITLVFNPPKAPFNLGNFVGAQIADVTAALDEAKVPFEITEVESDRPAGEVLSQDPAPGPVPGSTVVKLTVSKGLPTVVVPNVVNLSSSAAANQLGGLGLVTTEQPEASDTVAAGNVIRTDPPAGTEVDGQVAGGARGVERRRAGRGAQRGRHERVGRPRRPPERQPALQRGQRGRPLRLAAGQRRDRSDPGAGEQVAPNTTVTIRIGRPGPPPTNPTTTEAPPTT